MLIQMRHIDKIKAVATKRLDFLIILRTATKPMEAKIKSINGL